MRTSWSLNCSRTSSHSGVGGSSGSAGAKCQSGARGAKREGGESRTVLSVLLLLLLHAIVRQAVVFGDVEMTQDFLSRAHVGTLHGGRGGGKRSGKWVWWLTKGAVLEVDVLALYGPSFWRR